jgi:hypothetical protein
MSLFSRDFPKYTSIHAYQPWQVFHQITSAIASLQSLVVDPELGLRQ